MGFKSAITNDKGQLVGGWAKIWKVENKGRFAVAQVSTSKKVNGNYETDFQHNFVSLVGAAFDKIKAMDIPRGGLTIQILNCEVTARYSKEAKREYVNFAIYDFSTYEKAQTTQAAPKSANVENTGNEPLPFA